jgi:DNA-binding XRE family transcriptional regulator|tara:strand:- start:1042 stop:1446 length:405 start_codon:yes stop_codon:yes gene_type:complete
MKSTIKRPKTEYSQWQGHDMRYHRMDLGYTQVEMAKKLGITHRMYCFYESGDTPVSLPMEYAMKYLVQNKEKPFEEVLKNKSYLVFSRFERERMKKLRNALADQVEHGEQNPQFDFMYRMCRQAVKEIDNVLSK